MIRRLIASLLVICIALPLPSRAAMVATDAALAGAQRDQVNRLLERVDVQARLADYGVKAGELKARVAALSDDEVAQLAARMDALPAGGDGLITALLIIFIALLITDLLGVTHIFPFTKPLTR